MLIYLLHHFTAHTATILDFVYLEKHNSKNMRNTPFANYGLRRPFARSFKATVTEKKGHPDVTAQ